MNIVYEGDVATTNTYTTNNTSPAYTNTYLTLTGNSNYFPNTITTSVPNNSWNYIYFPDNSTENIKKVVEEVLKEKDNNSMNDFNFGLYYTNNIRLSTYGMAVKNASGKWVCYDKDKKQLIDVDVFSFDIDSSKVFYKMPVAVNAIIPGDILLHNGKLVFVEDIKDNKFEVIDPAAGTAITILPLLSPFGFNYCTRIVSLLECINMPASNDNPFGNLLPLMLMNDSNDSTSMFAIAMMNNQKELDPMMMALLLSGKNVNPLALMMLMKKDSKKEFTTVINERRSKES